MTAPTTAPAAFLADVPAHRLSIVVPMYNEVENVEPFVRTGTSRETINIIIRF